MTVSGERQGRGFTVGAVGNAYSAGYEVAFPDGGRGGYPRVQFRVFLDSGMNLVALASRAFGGATADDVMAACGIARGELAGNPNVFHVVENGFHEMQVLRRAVEDAARRLPEGHPALVEAEARADALEALVRDARAWSHDPSRAPFAEFMHERSVPAVRPGFEAVPFEGVGEGAAVHAPMGPVELAVAWAAVGADVPPTLIRDAAFYSPVRPVAMETESLGWPAFRDERLLHAFELHPGPSERALGALSRDAVVLSYMRWTEDAAFESFLGRFERWGVDPKVVVGSPDGTFSGRASALRAAFAASREARADPVSARPTA